MFVLLFLSCTPANRFTKDPRQAILLNQSRKRSLRMGFPEPTEGIIFRTVLTCTPATSSIQSLSATKPDPFEPRGSPTTEISEPKHFSEPPSWNPPPDKARSSRASARGTAASKIGDAARLSPGGEGTSAACPLVVSSLRKEMWPRSITSKLDRYRS